jgi:hypothetical protein
MQMQKIFDWIASVICALRPRRGGGRGWLHDALIEDSQTSNGLTKMTIVKQFRTATDFWSEMVEPDYKEYLQAPANLRRALHAASSLFHMSDWVFHTHEAAVRSTFKFANRQGNVQSVSKASEFADALEQQNPDFGRIRGIANAAKHLALRPTSIRPVQNAPSHAANTVVKVVGLLGQERWLGKFEQRAKWNFCLTAAMVAADQERR